jgi:hypothetical protein
MLFRHVVGNMKNVAFLFYELVFNRVACVTSAFFRAVDNHFARATTATRVVLAILFFASYFHGNIICNLF